MEHRGLLGVHALQPRHVEQCGGRSLGGHLHQVPPRHVELAARFADAGLLPGLLSGPLGRLRGIGF